MRELTNHSALRGQAIDHAFPFAEDEIDPQLRRNAFALVVLGCALFWVSVIFIAIELLS
jgi:hypothetical protein